MIHAWRAPVREPIPGPARGSGRAASFNVAPPGPASDVTWLRPAVALVSPRSLVVAGAVEAPLTLELARLGGLPQRTVVGAADGDAVRWTGVPLVELLRRARLLPDVEHGRATGGLPGGPPEMRVLRLTEALDADTLLLLRCNGRPLAAAPGAPLCLRWRSAGGLQLLPGLVRLEAVPFSHRP